MSSAPTTCCEGFCARASTPDDERDDSRLRAMQRFYDVGLCAPAERPFVHGTHGILVGSLFSSDEGFAHSR